MKLFFEDIHVAFLSNAGDQVRCVDILTASETVTLPHGGEMLVHKEKDRVCSNTVN